MVNLLKFVVSTLHVWEKRKECALAPAVATTIGHDMNIFSLGNFTLDRDYCFALADLYTSLDTVPVTAFRHTAWPLSVMVELIVCAVVLGYMWSAFWGDREWQFSLFYPACVVRAMSELESMKTVEVVRFRGGDRDVVSRATQLFHTIGTLPMLSKIAIDNYHQLPIQALTAVIRGLDFKQLVKSSCESDHHLSLHLEPPSFRKLQSLELHVEELTGSETHLDDLCAQMKQSKGFSSLQQLKLCFWTHTELEQTIRNEHTAARIVQALKHHPSLEHLEVRAPIAPPISQSKQSGNAANNSREPDPTCLKMPDALIRLVQTGKSLRRLRLNLWSRPDPARSEKSEGDNDAWYIAPLADAMSHPSFYAKSSLHSLELLFTPLPPQGVQFSKSLAALAQMVRHNYNITTLFVGGPTRNEDGSWPVYDNVYDYDNMLYRYNNSTTRTCINQQKKKHSTENNKVAHLLNSACLSLALNRLGKKKLLGDPNTTREDWIRTILQSRKDVTITFCWLSMNPEVLPLI